MHLSLSLLLLLGQRSILHLLKRSKLMLNLFLVWEFSLILLSKLLKLMPPTLAMEEF
jgi:hypothetical protein